MNDQFCSPNSQYYNSGGKGKGQSQIGRNNGKIKEDGKELYM
jgi:hypothetical protein